MQADEIAPQFFQEIIAMFFGSLALAYAVESVSLHRRIALFVLTKVGTSAKWWFPFSFHSNHSRGDRCFQEYGWTHVSDRLSFHVDQ
jgi:hypothetical protein